ncbi:hypothetical protein RRG08_006456 [Elysia crispata]|uniref:Uncharacterized protein n=1 Tax=Elysia crispata TaxID=231223 RepID=A0AAE1AF02_9GAST|nr:hypothetical protein RRG08_006456 [Elysia crispata]
MCRPESCEARLVLTLSQTTQWVMCRPESCEARLILTLSQTTQWVISRRRGQPLPSGSSRRPRTGQESGNTREAGLAAHR